MNSLFGFIPSGYILACAVLSALVPMGISLLTRKLYELGDPPWKKQDGGPDSADRR